MDIFKGFEFFDFIENCWGKLLLVFIVFTFLFFLLKKEWILFKNLRKKILFMYASEDIPEEFYQIEKTKLFKIENKKTTNDKRIFDCVKEYKIIIFYFDEKTQVEKLLQNIMNYSSSSEKQIIIYAKGSQLLTKEQFNMLYNYIHISICNTPIRLLNDIYTIMTLFPSK